MYKISLNKLIGLSIKAARSLKGYALPSMSSAQLFSFSAGSTVGKVWSWIERTDGVWLMFQRSDGGFYYVRADKGSFRATDSILEAYNQQKVEAEKQKIEDKGAIAYYIEKYGAWILAAIVGSVAIREIIKKKI